ncbi:hypothetical protein EV356DRAFT_497715 [Viridothelium virens]|uniref:Uncharacterized protein n=1 Tax=Viridothelium virens TaxID=1048519 RepID=A0A6A6HGZ0_VIRVR|nr:hypothetical protein EV356DRAFT_497715 [Viridothelium virens]
MWMDCTSQEHICDANCADILCFKGLRVLQRDNTNRSGKNTKSGAGLQPFAGDADKIKRRGIPQPPPGFTSAEENTYEGTAQGGAYTHITAARPEEQNVQKNNIQASYRAADPPIAQKKWFYRNFKNFGNSAPHCAALMQNPPDKSICDKRTETDGFDPKDYTVELDDPNASGFKTFHLLWSGAKSPKKRADENEIEADDED